MYLIRYLYLRHLFAAFFPFHSQCMCAVHAQHTTMCCNYHLCTTQLQYTWIVLNSLRTEHTAQSTYVYGISHSVWHLQPLYTTHERYKERETVFSLCVIFSLLSIPTEECSRSNWLISLAPHVAECVALVVVLEHVVIIVKVISVHLQCVLLKSRQRKKKKHEIFPNATCM